MSSRRIWTGKDMGKKIAIKFDRELLGDVGGNETAFTITGLEKQPPFYGWPKEREYAVEIVERYGGIANPSDDTILLTMSEPGRFNNAVGGLTVKYDKNRGTLSAFRPVESFEEEFTPTGLEPTPVNEHTVSANVNNLSLDYILIHHEPIKHEHSIEVEASGLSVELIYVGIITP